MKSFELVTVVCAIEEILKTVKKCQSAVVTALTKATALLVCNQLLLK